MNVVRCESSSSKEVATAGPHGNTTESSRHSADEESR